MVRWSKMIISRKSIEFANGYFKGKINTIAEVGAASGNHAKEMMQVLNPKLFYLVDCYSKKKDGNLDNRINAYNSLMGKIKLDNRYILIEEFSHIACNEVPNELDLVYIDAEHDYDNVKRDIACWYPKVRVGGILCGHDWAEHGVKIAVPEAFPIINSSTPKEKRAGWGLEFYENGNGDWWIIKMFNEKK